ncbi:inositol monophosphatase family protein [Streptomyces sudanensis]|uniref:inositol monophosphatase family protein n=1 Tax=Streptomyces sudanensis TaxID=436397 RepID=UPI0020CFD61D|nr:inositol monophosphatase [Streptomyces sudanensis]MCP9956862.1 inositol monophosphatase [Streptomyces sudanensis]MCP9986060.1 inositol monophosphatase [Streptomyces sudanensis]
MATTVTEDYAKLLPQLVEAVREAGELADSAHRDRPDGGTTVEEMMTAFAAVDGPVNGLLRDRTRMLRPEARWAEGEVGTRVADTGEWWVCDAIDGAVHYLQGLPYWSVTSTLVNGGRPVLSVVWAPRLDLLYTAVRGGGARLNGRPVAPSRKALSAALATTSQPPWNTEPERAGTSLTAMLRRTLAVRNLGPTSLQIAQVGSGHVDVFWEFGRDASNLLPGSLVATEAGALVTDATGREWTPDATSFVAAAPSLHGEVLDALADSAAGTC